MKIEKPVTDGMKQKCNTLYSALKMGKTLTKEQIAVLCGVNSERAAREIISVLASRRPIITTSDQRGYRLALTKDDRDAARHAWAELSSRIEELEKRILPLKAFLDKYDSVTEVSGYESKVKLS